MGRAAKFQGLEQEAEAVLGLLVADLQQLEDAPLHLLAVDTDGAAADLGAVEDHVVGPGQAGAGIGLQQVHLVLLGRGEGVVQGGPAPGVALALEHGEVHHPQGVPALGHQAQVLAQLDP